MADPVLKFPPEQKTPPRTADAAQRRGLSRSVPPVSRAVTTLMIGTVASACARKIAA